MKTDNILNKEISKIMKKRYKILNDFMKAYIACNGHDEYMLNPNNIVLVEQRDGLKIKWYFERRTK
jgi:hypothetical protein